MGHHPLVGLCLLIPGINIVMLYVFASGKWPIEYEKDALIQENARLRETMEKSEHAEQVST